MNMCFPWPSITYSQSHTLVVKRLRWRPRQGRAEDGDQDQAWVQLASAGADHAVKIFNIRISSLWLYPASGDWVKCVLGNLLCVGCLTSRWYLVSELTIFSCNHHSCSEWLFFTSASQLCFVLFCLSLVNMDYWTIYNVKNTICFVLL